MSPVTSEHIDEEIQRLLTEAHNTVKQILTERLAVMHKVAAFLKDKEVISGDELSQIVGQCPNCWVLRNAGSRIKGRVAKRHALALAWQRLLCY
ncbi:hypothetical protein [Sporomusa termitida]|uniref:ATP-dependent zinc metalloprotease FtsH n=1 Tax=Sporomusa termitida TaxID=2377 RepID=A0A517DQC6_9FIRM|nr:hypothetical protein [Sporomusa termitida]QDR79476.1 ATP-dependent zinc metalloprotease FtsH [Sporomusa termitida]